MPSAAAAVAAGECALIPEGSEASFPYLLLLLLPENAQYHHLTAFLRDVEGYVGSHQQ
jgi:hypothetical protein